MGICTIVGLRSINFIYFESITRLFIALLRFEKLAHEMKDEKTEHMSFRINFRDLSSKNATNTISRHLNQINMIASSELQKRK